MTKIANWASELRFCCLLSRITEFRQYVHWKLELTVYAISEWTKQWLADFVHPAHRKIETLNAFFSKNREIGSSMFGLTGSLQPKCEGKISKIVNTSLKAMFAREENSSEDASWDFERARGTLNLMSGVRDQICEFVRKLERGWRKDHQVKRKKAPCFPPVPPDKKVLNARTWKNVLRRNRTKRITPVAWQK